MTASVSEQVWFTPAQAHEAYGISTWNIRKLIREGEIPAKDNGGRYLVSRSAMDAYMATLPDA